MAKKEAEIKTREVVKEVSKRMNCYAKDARELLEHFASLVAEEAAQGRSVRFTPLGTFYARCSKRARKDGTRRLLLKFKPSITIMKKLEENQVVKGGAGGGGSPQIPS
ncbi:MAG: HU family DNA-binding protein [Thermacetogeniaceae bacterium]